MGKRKLENASDEQTHKSPEEQAFIRQIISDLTEIKQQAARRINGPVGRERRGGVGSAVEYNILVWQTMPEEDRLLENVKDQLRTSTIEEAPSILIAYQSEVSKHIPPQNLPAFNKSIIRLMQSCCVALQANSMQLNFT